MVRDSSVRGRAAAQLFRRLPAKFALRPAAPPAVCSSHHQLLGYRQQLHHQLGMPDWLHHQLGYEVSASHPQKHIIVPIINFKLSAAPETVDRRPSPDCLLLLGPEQQQRDIYYFFDPLGQNL